MTVVQVGSSMPPSSAEPRDGGGATKVLREVSPLDSTINQRGANALLGIFHILSLVEELNLFFFRRKLWCAIITMAVFNAGNAGSKDEEVESEMRQERTGGLKGCERRRRSRWSR